MQVYQRHLRGTVCLGVVTGANMPARQHDCQRRQLLTIRAGAITGEIATLRQAWSDNFHSVKNHAHGQRLLTRLSHLTAQASEVRWEVIALQQSGTSHTASAHPLQLPSGHDAGRR